jgi:hypothetical protein
MKFLAATFIAISLIAVMIFVGYRLQLRLGWEDLGAWGAYLTGTGTVLVGVMAIYAALEGLGEYRNRTRTQRMRWLEEFYERFYENTRFRYVRQLIDFGDFDVIRVLIQRDQVPDATFDQGERDLFDDFTDYLNFFEMLTYLRKKGQIQPDELEAMFGYYLRSIKRALQAEELLTYLQ